MSLHQKTRDYLFRQFIERNYQGSSPQIRKELLTIRPDEILGLKHSRQMLSRLHREMAEFLRSIQEKSTALAAQDVHGFLGRIYKSDYCLVYDLDTLQQNAQLLSCSGVQQKTYKNLKFTPAQFKRFIEEIKNAVSHESVVEGKEGTIIAELFPNLSLPVIHPVYSAGQIYAFAVLNDPHSLDRQDGAYREVVRGALAVFASKYRERDTESRLIQQKLKTDKLNRYYKSHLDSVKATIQPTAPTVAAAMKNLHIKRCALAKKDQGKLLMLSSWGFAKPSAGASVQLTAALSRTGTLEKDDLAYFNTAMPQKTAKARQLYIYYSPRDKQHAVLLYDVPAVSTKDTSLIETGAEIMFQLLTRMGTGAGVENTIPASN